MSSRMKTNALGLHLLARTKDPKLTRAIIANANKDLICTLCECAHNILKGNVRLNASQKAKLRRYKRNLRVLSDKQPGVTRKSKQGGGAFLTALLAPSATSIIFPLIKKLIP
ncbi:hypothetical protein NP493_1597g00002 [Ridgeia piscesae]|uniref:Uncharacterized protein n=1 Tax=Ridgeia piscesae TaxID=27915 RepID=A0AAD9N8Q0_RIDPI|nr:hypothetical protein NP493_1597g00002 [Ridgeia piscesae]